MIRTYTVGKLRQVIKESSNEFKPKIGDGVQKENEKNNKETYNKMKTKTTDYNGGIGNKGDKSAAGGDNKGMANYTYDTMNKRFSDDAKARALGYTSAQARQLHSGETLGNASYGSEEDLKNIKAKNDAFIDARNKATEIGLTGSKLDKKEVEKQRQHAFESKKMKRLNFKEKFLSEAHMLTKVPDDRKVDGNKFVMRDSQGTEYIVEWNNGKANVQKNLNMTLVNEEINRIKELWGYKSAEANQTSTPQSRLKENVDYRKILEHTRKLMK